MKLDHDPRMRPPEGAGRDELLELLSILWGARWIILGTALASAILGFSVSSILRPIYRAEVVITHASDSTAGSGGLSELAGQLGGLAGLVGVSFGSSNAAEPLGILRSRALADRFMQELGIATMVAGNGRKVRAASDEELSGRAYERFDRDVRRVLEDQESGLIKVRFEWYDRDKVAEWANRYVSLANQTVQERAISQSEMRLQYLQRAVGEAGSIELRQALFNLIESEVKARMLASIDNEIAFRVVDPAVSPLEQEVARPNRPLVTGVAFVAGLLMSIAISYIVGVIRLRAASRSAP